MIQFSYDGQTFELVERPIVAELRALRKWLGDGADALDNVIGTIAISIKRGRPAFDLRSVDSWDAETLTDISRQIEAAVKEQQPPAAADATTTDETPTADATPTEADPYNGLPDSEVPPTSDGSAPSAPPQLTPLTIASV